MNLLSILSDKDKFDLFHPKFDSHVTFEPCNKVKNNVTNIVWEPAFVLDKETEDRLIRLITATFAVYKHGFSFILPDEMEMFINNLRSQIPPLMINNSNNSNNNNENIDENEKKIHVNNLSEKQGILVADSHCIAKQIHHLHGCYLRTIALNGKKNVSNLKKNEPDLWQSFLTQKCQATGKPKLDRENLISLSNSFNIAPTRLLKEWLENNFIFFDSNFVVTLNDEKKEQCSNENDNDNDHNDDNDNDNNNDEKVDGKKNVLLNCSFKEKQLGSLKESSGIKKKRNCFRDDICVIPLENNVTSYDNWLKIIENDSKVFDKQKRIYSNYCSKYCQLSFETCENCMLIQMFDDSLNGYRGEKVSARNAGQKERISENKLELMIQNVINYLRKEYNCNLVKDNHDSDDANEEKRCLPMVEVLTEQDLRKLKFDDDYQINFQKSRLNDSWQYESSNSLKRLSQFSKENKGLCVTPDILFSQPILINGQKVNWIDVKNYYITTYDKLLFKKLKISVEKYCNIWGNGALLCYGYQYEAAKSLKNCQCIDCINWTI